MQSSEAQNHLSEIPYENVWSKAVQMHLTKFNNPHPYKEPMVPTLDTVREVEEDDLIYENFKYALHDASHSTSLELDDDDYTSFDPEIYMWRLRQAHPNLEDLPKKKIIAQISALSQQIDDLLKELERRKRVESYILPAGFERSLNPYHWSLNDFKSGSYRNIRGRGRGRLVYPEHDIHIRDPSRVGAVVSDNKMLL